MTTIEAIPNGLAKLGRRANRPNSALDDILREMKNGLAPNIQRGAFCIYSIVCHWCRVTAVHKRLSAARNSVMRSPFHDQRLKECAEEARPWMKILVGL